MPSFCNLLIYFFLLQILRLFSESAESIAVLKVDLADAKKRLGARNKQLHQLWYRSVTLRHIISLLDQIENIAKVCVACLPSSMQNFDLEIKSYVALCLLIYITPIRDATLCHCGNSSSAF